ncbi:YolD-like family protein [Gottfriedia acidiceleris]|uniref:YolD-like family protein n=1 Tax=Gottfriedia acidiceleris TaxID=371036 RepID=A0ABY4JQN9_9BACI|nr:YolD-like family protein [Gottfriedia acidiceleris]UPM56143.1 YolD-like family protein [Gottfriedia acidiceleris]
MKHNQLGRTIKKWQPFASIPQQFKGLANIIEDQRKMPKPILEDDEKERINFILIEALELNNQIALKHWNKGYIYTEVGHILKVDHLTDTFQFMDKYNQKQLFSFDSIVDIKILT